MNRHPKADGETFGEPSERPGPGWPIHDHQERRLFRQARAWSWPPPALPAADSSSEAPKGAVRRKPRTTRSESWVGGGITPTRT